MDPTEAVASVFARLDDQLKAYYDALATLADMLEEQTRLPEDEPFREHLDNLEWRLPLDEVRGYVLAARHELHGARTALVKAPRTYMVRRRPPNAETPDPVDQDPGERAPDRD